MVGLSRAGKVGGEAGVLRADDGVGSRYAECVQHGAGIVGESFAVAESRAIHLFGRRRLQSSDAQLDADVSGGPCQEVIDEAHALQVVGACSRPLRSVRRHERIRT